METSAEPSWRKSQDHLNRCSLRTVEGCSEASSLRLSFLEHALVAPFSLTRVQCVCAFVVVLCDHFWSQSAQEKKGAEANCHFSTYLKAAKHSHTPLSLISGERRCQDAARKRSLTSKQTRLDPSGRCAPFWRVAQSVLKATLDAEKFSSQPFMSFEGQNAKRSAAYVSCEESYL